MSKELKTALWVLAWSAVLAAALFVTLSARASERDPRCLQLEQLNEQYRGVTLTPSQKIFKIRATAWYSINCRGGRRSADNR